MKQNLKDSIEKWKKNQTARKEFRSVKSEKSKVVDGEYTITLKMAIKVTYLSESEEILLTSEVNTTQQSVDDNELDNPKGDVHVFESDAKRLEKDFEIKFEETYSKLWKSQTPEGFV
jgi:hypothetical protein